jgi:small subunit ribosomal protein S15
VTDEPPEWSDVDPEDVEEHIVSLAEEGHSKSEIGMILRDEGVQGTPVPDVTLATGKKVGEVLEERDASPDLPEDLRNLMERAVRLREHRERHPGDAQNLRALQNTEAKVRRLVNYYRGEEIDANFRYTYDLAKRLLR